MKICLVSQTFAPQDEGGAEISSRHAAQNLSLRHDVVVLALGLATAKNCAPAEHPIDAPYRLVRVNYRNSYLPGPGRPVVGKLTKIQWHLRNAIGAVDPQDLRHFFRSEKFDLIYAQNAARLQPALYDVAAELGIPVCQHLRDYALLCPRTSMYRGQANCKKPCSTCSLLTLRARRATRSVKSVMAVSDFVKQRFRANGLFPDANWHVLHNTNMAQADLNAELLAKRPDQAGQFTIGFLGGLTPEKGVEQLVRAFCRLPANLPAQLILAGRGQTDFIGRLQQLIAASAKADHVIWPGHVQPETVFSKVDVMIIPSLWHEPQSRVLIESAIYGVPVIAANTGGSPEVVDGYRTGWTYPADDPDALFAMLSRAVRYGAAGWRQAVPDLFPGLAGFKGSAEDTGYYMRLENVLLAAARNGL